MTARLARPIWVALAVLLLSVACATAAPERYALVIGNSDYDGDGKLRPGTAQNGYEDDLRNPGNDAQLIGRTLTDIGFKVTRVTDADLPMMQNALSDFANTVAAAPNDAVAVIYYSGHGLQVDGYNYLIPTRAKLERPDLPQMSPRIRQQILANLTVPADEILSVLGDRPRGMTILILDACRDNPWDRRVKGLDRGPLVRGLERMSAPEGAIVAFSTKANDVAPDGDGDNSPYALALSRWMKKPGLYVEQAFKQVGIELASQNGQQPDIETALRGDFCFNECAASEAEAEAKRNPPAAVASLAPGTPQAEVSTYVVFFDFERDNLTYRAMQVADEASQMIKRTKASECVVKGHIDTAETAAGMERKSPKAKALSLRRAEAVKSALRYFDIPDSQIKTIGAGDGEPIVPTAANVREPQNRFAVLDCKLPG